MLNFLEIESDIMLYVPFICCKCRDASLLMRVQPNHVARNDIFSLIWRCYGQKQDILDYWGKLIFF